MSFHTILFDLDGTLTDSAEGIVNSVVYALERKGIPYESKRALRFFVGPPLQDSFRDYCGFSEEQVKEAVRIFREYFTEKGIYENVVYDGVPGMLKGLCESGCTLAVATSKPEAFAEQILVRFDLIVADRGGGVVVFLRLVGGNEDDQRGQRARGKQKKRKKAQSARPE